MDQVGSFPLCVVELEGYKLSFMLMYIFSFFYNEYVLHNETHFLKNQKGKREQVDFKNSNNSHPNGAVLGLLVQEKLQNISFLAKASLSVGQTGGVWAAVTAGDVLLRFHDPTPGRRARPEARREAALLQCLA